jgi:DNA-binding Lrp family transcriptional regulator
MPVYTLQDIADMIGVSTRTVWNYKKKLIQEKKFKKTSPGTNLNDVDAEKMVTLLGFRFTPKK